MSRDGVQTLLGLDVPGLRIWLSTFLWFGIGVAPVAALLMLYSYVRYGTPFSSGYGDWETFSTPVWEGIFGLLFSPGKGILVYTPLFILLPFWAPSFVRRLRGFGMLLFSIIILHLALYGGWHVWWGAWGWASRFTVPILPLLVLLLAEGLSNMRRPLVKGLVLGLMALGVAVQILGISVHHSVYLSELMAINLRPDTLTLYDLSRSPILQQLRFMTRTWLDYAWIRSSGPDAVNLSTLAAAVIGAFVALAGFVVVWRSTRGLQWLAAVGVSALVVLGVVFQDLRAYYTQGDPAIIAIGEAFERAPSDAAVLHMMPLAVAPYANWQKRSFPELGWSEAPEASPAIVARLNELIPRSSEVWVVTDTPEKTRSNGVESMLTRSLVQLDQQQFGPFRLLRYGTRPEELPVVRTSYRFGDGILLAGFLVNGMPAVPGGTLNVTLEWRADERWASRPEYTVFVHLVTEDGTRVAQDDSRPANDLVPVSSWKPGQVVYDHHPIKIPPNAPAGLHRLLVGLYTLDDGKRAPVLDAGGKVLSSFVTLELN